MISWLGLAQNFLILILVSVVLLYLWFCKTYQYWKKKGAPSPKPTFPYGNVKELFEGSLHIGEQFMKLYFENKKDPFCGIYLAHKLAVLVNDLELIKNVLVKDFMHFTDHGLVHNEESEPLEGHLFNVNGSRWKNLRTRLIASFTPVKMKAMFPTLVEYAGVLQNHIDPQVDANLTIDLKELLSRYGTDIIGTCVFGIDTKSITSDSTHIRKMSKKSQRLNIFRSIIQNLSLMAPWIVERLRVSMYQTDVNKFFVKTAEDIVNYRKQNNLQANDYMQMLITLNDERKIEESKGRKIDAETKDDNTMSLGDLAAQLFVFFVDGVETSSTTSSFALYELARHPEIQEKLRNEIQEVISKHNGKLTYTALTDMKYLAQVVDETLRIYPPLPLLIRVCTKDYLIPGSNVTIDKGTTVMIPMLGIHRDPDIFPDPMEFKPDRFSKDNKEDRNPFTHLPFGEGPRMCMGTRFGPLMTRMGLISILSRYIISVEPKYVKPFRYLPNSFLLVPTEGINLNLTKLENPIELKL